MKSEFQFIRNIKDRFELSHVGDDCAVLAKNEVSDLLITADLLIEDVDFRLEWAKPADVGHKALSVSLSDIAAMGGIPTFAMLSLGVPKDLWQGDFLDGFYSGWHALAQTFGVELIGGDMSSADKLAIDSIVLGEVPKGKAIRRSGAKVGDLIYVSGSLGGAAAGLRMLESPGISTQWNEQSADLINNQLRPIPRVELAKQLRSLGIVTSMIDISDGISSDMTHICGSSRVGATIEGEWLPMNPKLTELFSQQEAVELALNGGEDFELLFTVVPDAADLVGDLPVTRIGTIVDSKKVELKIAGESRELLPKGFRHF